MVDLNSQRNVLEEVCVIAAEHLQTPPLWQIAPRPFASFHVLVCTCAIFRESAASGWMGMGERADSAWNWNIQPPGDMQD